jgi:hypothetical protein
MVVRRRRVTAVMVEETIMRGHIEAVIGSVNALCEPPDTGLILLPSAWHICSSIRSVSGWRQSAKFHR